MKYTSIRSKTRNLGFNGSGLFCRSIQRNNYGEYADNYNYSGQAIDKNETTDIILNSEDRFNKNRMMQNKYDRRSKKDMLECELRRLANLILKCRLYKQNIDFLRWKRGTPDRYYWIYKIYCYCICKCDIRCRISEAAA